MSLSALSPISKKKGGDDSANNSGSSPEEELRCLETLLSILTSSAQYYHRGALDSSVDASAVNDAVCPDEATEYVHLTVSVIKTSCRTPQELHAVLFDAPYDVIGVLGMIAAADMKYVPSTQIGGDLVVAFCNLRAAAIDALKAIFSMCAQQQQPIGSDAPESKKTATAQQTEEQQQLQRQQQLLKKLCLSAFERCGILPTLINVVSAPTSPQSLRIAASECIFVFSMNAAQQQQNQEESNNRNNNAISDAGLSALLAIAPIEPSATVRSYLCATVREAIGLDPARCRSINKCVSTLIRLASLDESEDVFSLCLGALEIIVRYETSVALETHGNNFSQPPSHQQSQQQQQAAVEHNIPLTEINDVLASRICGNTDKSKFISATTTASAAASSPQQQQHHHSRLSLCDDAAEAVCRLIEAAVHASCAVASEDLFKLCHAHDMHLTLVQLLERSSGGSPTVAASAIKALRALVERAPSNLSLASKLTSAMCLSILFRTTHEAKPSASIAHQIIAVESAIVIGLMLLFSAANRRKFLHEFSASFSLYSSALATKLQEHLVLASIEYFEDMIIVDEGGIVLNDDYGVQWEDDVNPSVDSIREIIDAQELRRKCIAGTQTWSNLQQRRSSSSIRRGYIGFVLLGYVTYKVLKKASGGGAGGGSTQQQPQQSQHRSGILDASDISGNNNTSAFADHRDRFVSTGETGDAQDEQQQRARTPRMQQQQQTGASSPQQQQRQNAAAASPLFPNVRRQQEATGHDEQQKQQQQQQEGGRSGGGEEHLSAEFEACLRLALHYAQHYHKLTNLQQAATVSNSSSKSASRGSISVRKGNSSSSSSSSKLPNPFAPPKIQRDQINVWTISAIQEGDLFFFSIPLDALVGPVVDAVIAKARKHSLRIKKALLTTPQASKNRRWFLHDMLHVIMPNIVTRLQRLAQFVSAHGDQHVQMALSVLPSIRTPQRDKCIYCGNLVEAADYLVFFFSKSAVQSSSSAAGATASGAGSPGGAAHHQLTGAALQSVTSAESATGSGHYSSRHHYDPTAVAARHSVGRSPHTHDNSSLSQFLLAGAGIGADGALAIDLMSDGSF